MKTKKQGNGIIYWLLPARDERELFCDIIRILCKQFHAANFEPHLTLFFAADNWRPKRNRGSQTVANSPKKILQSIDSGPIRLNVNRVAFSPRFSKTLFVRFEPDETLHKLVADLGRTAKVRAKAIRDPHVSLLYGKVASTVKKELASTIRLPFREVVFDKIAAVRSAAPIKTVADVAAWKIIASKTLDV